MEYGPRMYIDSGSGPTIRKSKGKKVKAKKQPARRTKFRQELKGIADRLELLCAQHRDMRQQTDAAETMPMGWRTARKRVVKSQDRLQKMKARPCRPRMTPWLLLALAAALLATASGAEVSQLIAKTKAGTYFFLCLYFSCLYFSCLYFS